MQWDTTHKTLSLTDLPGIFMHCRDLLIEAKHTLNKQKRKQHILHLWVVNTWNKIPE